MERFDRIAGALGSLKALECRCKVCGALVTIHLPPDVWNNPVLREAHRSAAYCGGCLDAKQREEEARKRQAADEARKAELRATYDERRKLSKIDDYLLPFDYNHPKANRALWDWMKNHAPNQSVLLSGESGQGKSRVLSGFAEMALDSKTVVYRTAADLCDELGAAFMRKEAWGLGFLEKLKMADLLVIDDLGKEAMSDSRVMRLWQLIDARYTASVQRLSGRRPRYGWQIWISSNWHVEPLIERMGRINAEPIMRRLVDITEIWKG